MAFTEPSEIMGAGIVTPEIADNEPDTAEIVTALRREADAAENEWELYRDIQDLAYSFYEAQPFGNEDDGQSQIVLPDVQETVDSMHASVLRTFVSGERVVEFEATNEEDEETAEEATAAIGYNFMRRQDGYRTLSDWLYSGLLERYGAVKTAIVQEERVTRSKVTIVDPVELEGIDGEIEDSVEHPDGSRTVLIKRQRTEKKSVDIAIPAEEFRFTPRARHEDDADYLAHVCVKTRSELVEMGFDQDQVYSLPAHQTPVEVRNRGDEDNWDIVESTPALERILLHEEYARLDVDDDGIAERVQVFRVENEILRWSDGELAIETVEDNPFSVFTAFLRPHRMVGWSLADKVMDLQLGRSMIARQLFDGMRNANLPRPIVAEGGASENTFDDILSPVAGAPIRVKDLNAIQPYQTNFDVGKSLSVMEWMSREGQARSGAVRSAQVLDPDTLNAQSATEFAGNREDNQVKQELIARNFAEAFSRLMAKKYRMMRAEGEPFRIKVDGQYKLVDPAAWPEDMNIVIRVGLGTNSKDKRIQARMAIAPMLAEGFANKQVKPKHLFHAVDGLVRDLGIGQGSDYWIDPDAPPEIDPATGQPVEEQEEPSPEEMAAQAEMQREQQKMQLEQAKAQAQVQTTRDTNAANIEAMREKHALEMQQKREAAQLDAQLERDRAETEAEIAVYRIDREAEVKMYAAQMGRQDSGDIGQNREGGDLDK